MSRLNAIRSTTRQSSTAAGQASILHNRNGRLVGGMHRQENVNNAANNNDLDSSNVLYDEDFEIEEDKANYFSNN